MKTEDKDENNKKIQYEYNQQNCLIKIWPADDPNKTGTPILLEYYLDGQLKSVTDRKNQKTTLTYDGGHRQTKITYADTTKFEEFTFSATSQLTSRKKQDGNIINYTYDERARRTGIDYPTGTDHIHTRQRLAAHADGRWDGDIYVHVFR